MVERREHIAHSASGNARRAALGTRFITVWSGQTASAIGSNVAGIGMAVFVFLETASAAWLGVLAAAAAAPYALLGPVLHHVDRWPRKTVMIAGDSVAAAGTVFALVMAATGHLEIWHLAVGAALGGIGSAFQTPAAQAAVPLLVAPEALGRANGLAQLGPAVGIVAGPLLAAPLVGWWGITAVLVVDLVTFLVALVTVIAVPIDGRADRTTSRSEPHERSGWRPAIDWLRGEGRPLLTLLAAGAAVNGFLAFFNVSLLSLATDLGGTDRVGVVMAAVGVSMIVGSLLAARWGVAEDRVGVLSIALGGVGVGTLVAAIRPSLWAVGAGAALAVLLVPLANAATATIYHERVPADLHGRVFAVRGVIGRSLDPLGSLVSGLVIARVAGPAMSDGPASELLGPVIGSGADRGPALVLVVVGVAVLSCAAYLARCAARPALRQPVEPTTATPEPEPVGA